MLGLKLNHVSKRGPRGLNCDRWITVRSCWLCWKRFHVKTSSSWSYPDSTQLPKYPRDDRTITPDWPGEAPVTPTSYDTIPWKPLPQYWPFVWRKHWSLLYILSFTWWIVLRKRKNTFAFSIISKHKYFMCNWNPPHGRHKSICLIRSIP